MRRPISSTRAAERGQATIETLVLTTLLVMFIAAVYQLSLINQTVYRALTASHATLFQRAMARNCVEEKPECEYSQNPGGDGLSGADTQVVWAFQYGVPEVSIPVTDKFILPVMLGRLALDKDHKLTKPRIYSNRKADASDTSTPSCPDQPCKVTRVGAGNYKSLIDGLLFLKGAKLDGIDIGNVLESIQGLSSSYLP